ncbi:MAG: hypothetical protein PHH70_01765 [Candidatus Gracilibacteria bacterium]|nr:hypothetical protein [Candidatus Gracilibacteria bacterium]
MQIKNSGNLRKILSVIIAISLIAFGIFKYQEIKYYNNYFLYNESKLMELKDYIEKKNLEGYIYINEDLDAVLVTAKEEGLFRGELGNYIKSKKDPYLNILISELNIGYISNDQQQITVVVNKNIYGDEYNVIYYDPGYYKGKKELDEIDGSRFNVILKIFNDDWGVIDGCYGCNFGAWD